MLSEYREKLKKAYEETESGRIAFAIWDNRETIGYKGLCADEEVDLGDDVKAFQEGTLALIVTKPVFDKPNHFWYKVLPVFEMDVDKLYDILDVQDWRYF